MKYAKKYYAFWAAGIVVSFVGVLMARKTDVGSPSMYIGYLLAFTGLSIIAWGVSRKS